MHSTKNACYTQRRQTSRDSFLDHLRKSWGTTAVKLVIIHIYLLGKLNNLVRNVCIWLVFMFLCVVINVMAWTGTTFNISFVVHISWIKNALRPCYLTFASTVSVKRCAYFCKQVIVSYIYSFSFIFPLKHFD